MNINEKIAELKNMANQNLVAKDLLELIEQECGNLVDEPKKASSYQIRRYNEIVRSSELPLPIRKKLFIKK